MSEYDSDAMDKVRKQGIKKARTKNPAARMPPNRTKNPAEYRREQDNTHIMRGNRRKERRGAKDPRTERRIRRNTAGNRTKRGEY